MAKYAKKNKALSNNDFQTFLFVIIVENILLALKFSLSIHKYVHIYTHKNRYLTRMLECIYKFIYIYVYIITSSMGYLSILNAVYSIFFSFHYVPLYADTFHQINFTNEL